MIRPKFVSRFCLTLIATVILSGCGSSLESVETRKVYLGDGTRAYRLSCGNPRQAANDCYEQAGHLCDDKGYVVTQQNGAPMPAETETSAPMLAHDVFVKCRG